jgi:ATP-dependent helicase STH1/SNF2
MELRKQTEGHPEFANFDDPGSIAGDGQSTGADTPLTAGTPGAQPKLRLTFNNSNFDSASTMNGTDFSLDEE